ncbi:MAG: hypothetical protein E7184_01465 [Erysipelotrichaceae bacterium]|nr:hypothetical protein [Erysipelotrichaceae bacterium]
MLIIHHPFGQKSDIAKFFSFSFKKHLSNLSNLSSISFSLSISNSISISFSISISISISISVLHISYIVTNQMKQKVHIFNSLNIEVFEWLEMSLLCPTFAQNQSKSIFFWDC